MLRILLVCCALYSTAVLAQDACQQKRLADVKTLAQKVRGVNLGSWVVMESWMAASVWDSHGCDKGSAQGSYLLEKCLGGKAQQVLEQHWNSFITENDFAEMSKHGINVVRLPVGWWQIYDKDGGVQKVQLNRTITPKDYIAVGALNIIDKAFAWGQKYGIGVLLDMHAAPGSQNGFDNSSPPKPGEVDWHKYPANVDQTIDSMELYAIRYGNHPALFGFELLNEPANGPDHNILQSYYSRAYTKIRAHSPGSWIVIMAPIIPGESGTESWWTGFMNPPQYTKVAMDLHYYSCFSGPSDQTNPDGAIGYINFDRKNQISDYANKNHKPMLIGEWSACAHIPNNRWADFMRAEVNIFGTATMGWTFWSWTVGSGTQWSLKTIFNQGWISDFYKC